MNKNYIKYRINELEKEQPWNHNFELPFGLKTKPEKQISHAKNLVKLKRLLPIFDALNIKNKNILDLGCNEGFFSMIAAKKGAKVIGLDIDDKRIKKAKFIKSLLGKNLSYKFKKIDIYNNSFDKLINFDLCFCFGFLHRIPDPFSAISRISKKTDLIIFEWKSLKWGHHNLPLAYFSEKNIDVDDYYGTEYWLLSYKCLETVLNRNEFKYFYKLDDPSQNRSILVAGKKYHEIFGKKDIILSRSKLRLFLSHTKLYLKTVINILIGKIN